ncbi:MAG: type 4b pilus protein PilO2 [Betaproteobacteria bacterium]|nr:type 4b pilus protein PilO2 [Betaproteobacteria bacterium]
MKNTVKIGKTVWAVGMTWRSYGERPTIAELRDDAEDLKTQWDRENGKDNTILAAVRVSGQARQGGFMPDDPGEKRPSGIYSLAAAIADAREQPWLGIFRIGENKWWYIAVREGQAVLPDGDVVGDEETILAARANHESYADWSYVKGDLADLRGLIEEQGKTLRRVPVKSLKPVSLVLPAAAAGVAIICLAGGFMWWHNYEVTQQQRRAAAAMAAAMKLKAEQAAISPLIKTPAPSLWLTACVNDLEAQPISQDAWTAAKLACDTNGAIISWQREDGATVAARPNGVVDNTGDKITQIIEFPTFSNGPDNAKGLDASNMALLQLLQPLGIEPQISAPVQPQPLPGAAAASQPPTTPEETVNMTIPINPTDLDFDQVPGLRLDNLSIDDQGDWVIAGEIYGR